MPAKSKSQQKFMGMVHALQKGELSPSDVSAKVKDVADRIGDEDAEDFASTKHSGKPEKVAKETLRKIRDAIRTELESCGYTHTVDGDKLKSPGGTGPEDREFKVDEDVDEGFGSEDTLDKKGIKEFEQWRKDNAEQLGYTLSGTPDVKEERDYKAEYKKFQSSTKSKKYRADLNQYNRKKGTYGNGDGKDASHKGGKIVGFETQSKNRGRAEKSRLKQERASVGDVGLGFLIDQLINSMEHYDEREFIKHMKKELDLKPQDSKKLWKLYWKLPPRKRMRMWPQEWEKVLKRIGITESVNEARSTNREWNKFEKDYGDFFKTVVKLGKANTKLTGDKTDEKIFLTNFTRNVGKFYTLMKSWKRGQNESVNEGTTLLTEGYTNYWKHTEDFTPREWTKIVRLAKTAIKRAERGGIVIRDGFGKGKPKIDNKQIYLNGDGENNLDHETFLLTKKKDSGFTKTNRKPYDAVVATILVGIEKIAPKKFSAGADGRLKIGGINNWKNESIKETVSINESAVSFWQDMFRPGPIPKKYITQLIKKRGELPSKKHIKKIYRDNGNPSSRELAKTWKDLTKEKYVRAASGMWRWNSSFTGWESVNETWSTGLERYKVTLENGEEIDVKVKEGKGLEGLEELLGKEGLKFEKITKKASRPTLTSESVNEKTVQTLGKVRLSSIQKKAILIAMQMFGNMTGAVKKIEKLKKGLSNDKKVAAALRFANESVNESINEDIGIDVYLGGIVKSMRKVGLKPKTAKQMKRGFSKSRDKVGFFIDVEQRGFDRKEKYTLQLEVDRDGNLWYLSGHRPVKLGKWADTNKIARGFKALNKIRGFGQKTFQKKESVNEIKRCTVKEVSKWLKTLEEFRYRKVRGVDARRVASFVNRGMNEEDLPMSLRKKWEHRKYGRERHLAEKYLATITEDKL